MGEENQAPKAEENKVDVDAVIKERDTYAQQAKELNERLAKIEAEQNKAQEQSLKEQNKYKELYEGVKAKAERHDVLEAGLQEYFETEIAEIPEDKRDLIPEGSVESRLKWVKQAKQKGLFNPQKANTTPVNTATRKPNSDPTQPEYLSWSPNDPRLLKLSISEARNYRSHRQAVPAGNRGWGGVA